MSSLFARCFHSSSSCMPLRFRPVTASSRADDSDSDDDDKTKRAAAAAGEKRKRDYDMRAEVCHLPTKRKKEREARELKEYVGKAGVAAKKADRAAAKAHPSSAGLPAVDWTAEQLAPFDRSFWPAGADWDPLDPAAPTAECKLARKTLGIVVRGAAAPPPVESLTDSRLPASVKKFLKHATTFERPTPVQARGSRMSLDHF
jgi:hypothetical protein